MSYKYDLCIRAMVSDYKRRRFAEIRDYDERMDKVVF